MLVLTWRRLRFWAAAWTLCSTCSPAARTSAARASASWPNCSKVLTRRTPSPDDGPRLHLPAARSWQGLRQDRCGVEACQETRALRRMAGRKWKAAMRRSLRLSPPARDPEIFFYYCVIWNFAWTSWFWNFRPQLLKLLGICLTCFMLLFTLICFFYASKTQDYPDATQQFGWCHCDAVVARSHVTFLFLFYWQY